MTIYEALAMIGHPVTPHPREHQEYCPFHKGGKEQSRSARVYPKTDSMYCFRCHRSWTPIQVIQTHFGVSHAEAKRYAGGGQEPTFRTENVDKTLANVLRAIGQFPIPKRVQMLKDFDPIWVRAARGDDDRAVSRACTRFADQFLNPSITHHISA